MRAYLLRFNNHRVRNECIMCNAHKALLKIFRANKYLDS